MRFVFLWLCAILFSGVVYGESDRDSLKVRLGAPRLNLGSPVLLTDSIPGAFIERLDELYSKWYVSRLGEGNYVDSVYLTEMVTGPAVPDSVYLQRLDKLNSAIKLSYNDIVRNYIELYTVRRRAQVGTMLGLSSYYFPIFEEVLDREGLPQELKYLPVIESALNPRAFSRAGACGLWQFMYGTGKMYKLEINSFIDERRDPVKSTEAAVCFLKDLYKIYEDWILVIAAYNEVWDGFDAIIPISAHKGGGLDDLMHELQKYAQEGPQLFPDGETTDQPERQVMGELLREKLLLCLDKEIPHGTAVEVTKFSEREDTGIIDLDVTIYCEKASHKGIIIGRGGEMLKRISSAARRDIEKFMGTKVYMETWVKVKENWRDNPNFIRSQGYNEE